MGEYVQLRNAGGGALKGLCPFHDEKSPSFNVSNGLWHCLAGETRVVTWDGPRPIRELAGGVHRVLGRDGEWLDAPFFSFGVQPLLRIELARAGRRREIHATAGHRWFVRAGAVREVVTRDLRPGDRLVAVRAAAGAREWRGERRVPGSGADFGAAFGESPLAGAPAGNGAGNGSGARTAVFDPPAEGWTVESVAATDRVEEVFCAVVAQGHAFVLDGDILTGNCFGCAEGGDAITFIQKIEHLSFSEAIERLAAKAGIQLRYTEGGYVPGRQKGERTRLVEAHRAAAEFYAEQLLTPAAEIGRRFLAERGFGREEAERFGCGYAPNEWEALVRHLRGRGFSDKELITGGLASQGRRGPIDRFRGRLIWPIRDLTGDVVGFGARRLEERDDGPKYLNTPETPLFKKGSVLYGADLAKKEIARRRQAVIVEGYTDVMACHLAGVGTAIATSGTSFGDEHIKILRRLLMDQDEASGEIIFTFDGDAAGQRAALRAFESEHKFAAQTFVAVQPDGLDPCDLRMKHGDAAVRDLVASRVPLFRFAIRATIERYDLDTTEGRLAAIDAAAPIVASIRDRGMRERYAIDLDRWTGFLDEQFVLRRVREHAGRRRDSRRPAAAPEAPRTPPPAPAYDPNDPIVRVERETLKLAVQRPALLGPAFDALPADALVVPGHAAVRELIAELGGTAAATGSDWPSRLREAAPNDAVKDLVTSLAVEPLQTSGDPDNRYANAMLSRLQEVQVTRMITKLQSKLGRLNPVGNQEEYNRLFGDLVALEQERRTLRERAIGSL